VLPKNLVAAKQYLMRSKAQGNTKAKRLYQSLFTTNNRSISSKQLQIDLKSAIIKSDLKHVNTLYNQGVNLRDYISNKQTPLMIALKNNQENIALWLTKTLYADHNSSSTPLSKSTLSSKTSSWEIKDNLGNTALHLAVKYKQANIVSLLVRYKANINAINQSKQTPLILAILNNERVVAQYLINEGALVSLKDKKNKTAFYYAKQLQMKLVFNNKGKNKENSH